jgi:hypothetical protein
MRIPQVTDRMKEAPTQALRTFFSGIGQFLLAAEKTRTPPGKAAGEAGASRAEQNRKAAPGPAADSYSTRWRSLDKTGNVRILEPDEHELEPEAGEWPARSEATGPTGPAELPVPSYDSLSLASIRARLRLLDRDQLAVLLDYERAGARRSEFLTMFERRIARLDSARLDSARLDSARLDSAQA